MTHPNIFHAYYSNRQEGENESYICKLIRQDSIVEFVQYVNRMNYPLSSQIPPSLFEANSFLIENENTTLIEYSVFFCSIQIFLYLMLNKVDLKPSLWLYAIHSKNAELIHILESKLKSPKKVENDQIFLRLLIKSIKCHHNDFANYFANNFMFLDENDSKQKDEILSCSIKYHHYSIGYSGFNKCSSLKQITIPSSVTSIDCYAFHECSSLTEIIILSSVTSIGCFEKCSLITQITIPSKVTKIEKYTFANCTSLKRIEIPSSVNFIDEYAFCGCTSLIEIKIPESVTTIYDYKFFSCKSLIKVEIP